MPPRQASVIDRKNVPERLARLESQLGHRFKDTVLFHKDRRSGMSRVTGIADSQANLGTRLLFWLVKRRRSKVHRGLRIRAYDPKLLALSLRMDKHTAAPRSRFNRTFNVEAEGFSKDRFCPLPNR
jgi:hypothetical protein